MSYLLCPNFPIFHNHFKNHFSRTLESLTDSIISLSIADQVKAENEQLSNQNIDAIRNLLENRHTITIKPNRPERSDINSIVVLEKRYQGEFKNLKFIRIEI